MEKTIRHKLIVALDVPGARQARKLVSALQGIVGMFKVGPQLFTAAGPEIVREIIKSGEPVFLDLKFHDIPNTVASAGVEAARLGVAIFNVHAFGGSDMMRRTAAAVSEIAEAEGLTRPAILAVTVLTSADSATLAEVGNTLSPEKHVRHLSLLAARCGMDGVVASPREIALVRDSVQQDAFLVVTPGVRPSGSDVNDQKRTMTASEAIAAGADYLVIGRPITQAKDPGLAAERIIGEMATAAS